MPMSVDLSGLRAAIREREAISRYTEAECLNNAVKTILIGSSNGQGLVQLTRKATVERITADLNQPVTGTVGSGLSNRKQRPSVKPRLFWLALNWMKHRMAGGVLFTKENVRDAMQRIKRARIKSRAYIAAGWLWAARDLVQFLPNQKLTGLKETRLPTKDNGTAKLSHVIPATGNNSRCVVYNYSRGAEVICTQDVYQTAINNATTDINIYIARKMGEEMGRILAKNLRKSS